MVSAEEDGHNLSIRYKVSGIKRENIFIVLVFLGSGRVSKIQEKVKIILHSEEQ